MNHYSFHVYILTNSTKSTFYTGVTNSLENRLLEHYLNRGNPKSFAGRFYCYNLLYYEHHQYINNAISREKEIKKFSKKRKRELISTMNPEFNFLNKTIMEWPPKEIKPNRF